MVAAIVRARVEATAPHYQPRPRGVSLKAVRERLRAKAEAECAAIARGGGGWRLFDRLEAEQSHFGRCSGS